MNKRQFEELYYKGTHRHPMCRCVTTPMYKLKDVTKEIAFGATLLMNLSKN